MPPRVRLLTHPRVCALSRPPIRSQSSLRSFIESLHQSPEDKSAATEDAHDKSAGSKDARDSLQVQKELYHIGTVTTKNPSNTDISSLIDQIEPVPFLIPDHKLPTAMLLVTPSFASALKPLEVGAPEAITQAASRMLQQSLEHATLLKGIRVVAAVVDRLPSPEDSSQASKGREGLAYALWFNDNVTRHSWTAERDAKRISERNDASASISFDIFDRFKLADLEGQPRKDYSTTIIRLRLPLANTLFQTGHTSIMYNILYRASKIDEPVHSEHAALQHRRTLHAEKVIKTDSQRVTWPVSGRYLAHKISHFPVEHETLHQLRAPLVPLTPPREVKAGMGNIIRQIMGPDGKEAPASQELEKAVSSYFEATGQAPHAMPVWALVTSEKTTKYFSSSILSALEKWQPRRFSQMYDYAGISSLFLADAWNADHKLFHTAVWKVLLRGNGKLHRVLSGGGGWGKKAGLISLDPAKSISEAAENAADVDEMDLRPVAVPGSYITFLTSPVSSLELPKYEQDTCAFGTIPSTIDDIPDTTTEGPSSIDAWPGYFGALSEQGMSINSAKYEIRNAKGQF
ncbi:hypothetical protein BFW01_g8667 [Lasiodiplodia theobromae]|nr:hypothetical protein BFW01_g8667 [Lasiodiplodia theobromae]